MSTARFHDDRSSDDDDDDQTPCRPRTTAVGFVVRKNTGQKLLPCRSSDYSTRHVKKIKNKLTSNNVNLFLFYCFTIILAVGIRVSLGEITGSIPRVALVFSTAAPDGRSKLTINNRSTDSASTLSYSYRRDPSSTSRHVKGTVAVVR